MIADVILSFVTALLLLVAVAARPEHGRCAPGFHADGIRRSGYFECARPYGCRDAQGPRGGWTSTCAGEERVGSRIYCTGGTQPVLDGDGVTVGCQRGGWEP